MSVNTNLYKMCRICLRPEEQYKQRGVSIFNKRNESVISDNITLVANVKIKKGDGLPEKICPDCLSELDTAVNFKMKCESSYSFLNSTHSSLKKTDHNKYVKKESTKSEKFSIEVPIKKEEYEEIDMLDEYFDYDFQICNGGNVNNESPSEFNSQVLKSNINKEPTSSSKINSTVQCNECGEFFKSKCKLRVHWKKTHLYKSLICNKCKRMFKSYKAYNKHVKVKSISCVTASKINIEGVGAGRVFHCKECNYKTGNIKGMNTHLRTHTGDKPFLCNLCPKAYNQQSTLQAHKESAHGVIMAETTCQYCGKYLKGRIKIYRHLSHHRMNYVQCDICKKMLKSKATLAIHIQRHTGIKSYTCEKCAGAFYTMSELCNHKRTVHEKGKHTYTCGICEYKAYRSEIIKRHRDKHTETNISCIVCGMFLENAEKFAEHQKRHFADRKYSCPHCEKRFLNRKNLSQHVRTVHKCKFLMKKREIKMENVEGSVQNMPMIDVELLPLNNS